ncbi:MAG: hypothetical protein K1X89_22605 [Myxococcaceae bacterium]|nr:hypothetical protein [Myxococcaceae bacterium]
MLSSLTAITFLAGALPVLQPTATGFRFEDGAGEHRLTIVRTAKHRAANLQVTHEVKAPKGTWTRVFQANDFVPTCEFDLTLELVKDSVQLSDADGDGEVELSFAYVLGCRSDVSPLTLKLLLYEGATKYALRGTNRVLVGQDEQGKPQFEGGDHQADPAFKAAAPLLAYAETRWKLALEALLSP